MEVRPSGEDRGEERAENGVVYYSTRPYHILVYRCTSIINYSSKLQNFGNNEKPRIQLNLTQCLSFAEKSRLKMISCLMSTLN